MAVILQKLKLMLQSMCHRLSLTVFGEGDRIEGVEKMREAGVGRIMVPGFIFGGPSGMEQLQEFGERSRNLLY